MFRSNPGGEGVMRLYKVVILVNSALVVGFLAGSLWWAEEVGRLRRELAAARPPAKTSPGTEQRGTGQGIVRGVFPEKGLIYISHEDVPGLMPSMTMGFRAEDPNLTRGLAPGDRVRFTAEKTGNKYTVIALHKEGGSR
jgi:Cu/Ag efflux protein CusF